MEKIIGSNLEVNNLLIRALLAILYYGESYATSRSFGNIRHSTTNFLASRL